MDIIESHLKILEHGIKIKESQNLKQSVHWTPSESFPVHRWFRYREGFSPYLLEHFSDAKHRLDPFCGCGTTLLESARQGAFSYGVDLNPLATFVAKVKTNRYSGLERNEFENNYKNSIKEYKGCIPSEVPPYPLLEKLFLPESLETLLKLKTFISNIESTKVRNLLKLSSLSIIERSSNVFKEGNGLKYRNKRRKPGKYETKPDKEWIPKYFGNSINGFIEKLWDEKCASIAEDIEGFRLAEGFTPRIRTGSCLNPKILDFGHPIDLAIYSPPYANRFDYFEAFKMELWLGDFVQEKDGMARLKAESVRNNLTARKYEIPKEGWAPLKPFIDAMDSESSSVRMGIKSALYGYFHDNRILLKNLNNVLAPKGQVVIVIGNSAYAKSIIPSDVLIARIGEEEGYKIKAVNIARNLHVSSQQRSSLNHLSK